MTFRIKSLPAGSNIDSWLVQHCAFEVIENLAQMRLSTCCTHSPSNPHNGCWFTRQDGASCRTRSPVNRIFQHARNRKIILWGHDQYRIRLTNLLLKVTDCLWL